MSPRALELPAAPAVPHRLAAWLDLATSQAAWWWCILGARSERAALALLGPAAYLLGHLLLARGERQSVLRLATAGAAIGLLGDAILASSGLLTLPPSLTWGPVAPFLVALWAMFAVSLQNSAAFLVRLPAWQAAVLGAVAGPLAYAGGERLGVLSLSGWAPWAVGLEWALAVPIIAACARAAARQVRS